MMLLLLLHVANGNRNRNRNLSAVMSAHAESLLLFADVLQSSHLLPGRNPLSIEVVDAFWIRLFRAARFLKRINVNIL